MGNQEKFICVNRSNREQQNPQPIHRTRWNLGWAKVSENSPEEGKMHLQERVQGSAEEGACSKKKILSAQRKGGAWAPPWGDNHPLTSQAKEQVRYIVPSDGSMFLGCKLIGHGRDFQILAIDSSYGIKITFSFCFFLILDLRIVCYKTPQLRNIET